MRKNKVFFILTMVAICLLVVGLVISGIGIAMQVNRIKNTEPIEISEMKLETVNKMDISLDFGIIEILKGEEFKIEMRNFEKDTIVYDVKDNLLTIKENRASKWFDFNLGFMWNKYRPTLIVYVTDENIFQNVKINVAAGSIDAKNITTESLEIMCDAGSIEGTSLMAEKAVISNNAGNIDLKNVDFNGLSATCDFGAIKITGNLTGQIDVTNAVGEIKLEIDGYKGDYYVNAKGSIGSIRVDNESYDEKYFDRNASNTIKLENDIGEIRVVFRK